MDSTLILVIGETHHFYSNWFMIIKNETTILSLPLKTVNFISKWLSPRRRESEGELQQQSMDVCDWSTNNASPFVHSLSTDNWNRYQLVANYVRGIQVQLPFIVNEMDNQTDKIFNGKGELRWRERRKEKKRKAGKLGNKLW